MVLKISAIIKYNFANPEMFYFLLKILSKSL